MRTKSEAQNYYREKTSKIYNCWLKWGSGRKTPKVISLEALKVLWIIMGKCAKIGLRGRGNELVFQYVARLVAFKLNVLCTLVNRELERR